MNTADLRTFPLYTVTNRRGEVAQWMPANVAFTASNRASADDCALALRHYDADIAWSNDITGEWTVTENREPFAVATFAKHATACDALRTLKATRHVTARLDRTAEGFVLMVTGRRAA